MNYLAHAYLSFEDAEVLTGNMISDFVKGKKKFAYAPRILAGIDLHRAIDRFTDDHPVNKQAAAIFKPVYKLYASAFLDVVYDHFLALELAAGDDAAFLTFTRRTYERMSLHAAVFPEYFQSIFPYMTRHNWLYNYQFSWGIQRSMEGLVHRAAYLSDSETAFVLFTDSYGALQDAFRSFFPELKAYALEKFSDIH